MAEAQTPPEGQVPAGRYEVTAEQFAATLKDEPRESIQQFDLKTAFPEILVGTTRLPRLADRIWRRVMDEAVSEFGGAYAPVKASTFVQLWLEHAPVGVAKVRMAALAARMADIHKRAREQGPDVDFESLFLTLKDQRAAPQLSPELTKLMQSGLPANPAPDIFELWLARTTQALIHAQQKTPFAKEIMEVVAKADLAFMPVWTCANELLVGAFAQVRCNVPANAYTAAEPVRQDMLACFAACMQLTVMVSKKVQALAMVSMRPATLSSKTAMDLLALFLSRVSPDVKKNLIVEVKGLPKGVLAPAVRTSLDMLAPQVKAMLLDTGLFAKDEVLHDLPKLHAHGFDLQGLPLPEVEIAAQIRKYAETHKRHGHRLYIKGMPMPYLVKVAKESGYTYLSGPAVHGPEKFVTGVRAFPIRLP